MKYIMFETTKGTLSRKLPIIFPNTLVHSLVARSLMPMLREEWDRVQVVSAGEIIIDEVNCFGQSETLKLKPNNDDAEIIEMYDLFHGV